jgi:hypothetical protein
MHIYNNLNHTKSVESRNTTFMSTFVFMKYIGLIESQVEAEAGIAGSASTILPTAGAA